MSELVTLRFSVAGQSEDAFLATLGPSVDRGGMFLPSTEPLPEGTAVALEFTLANQAVAFVCEAEVVSCRPPSMTRRPGMLLRFTSVAGSDLRRLERALALCEGTQDAPLPDRASPPTEPRDPLAPPPGGRRVSRPSSPGGPAPVLGIDFGPTSCRAAVFSERGMKLLELEGKSPALPSAVAFDDRDRMMLGTRARAQQAVDPRSAVVDLRRLLGLRPGSDLARALTARLPYEVCLDPFGEGAVRVRGKVFSITELASKLLAEIRHRASDTLGRSIRHAVISAPSNSTERQRQAVRAAAHLAGLRVDLVLGEPLAIATAWCHRRGRAPRHLLIFDLGGSSFTATLVHVDEDSFRVVGGAHDPNLGGTAFDQRLEQFLVDSFQRSTGLSVDDPLTRQRVRDAAAAAKVALSSAEEVPVHVPWAAGDSKGAPVDLHVVVSRAQLESMTSDLVGRAVALARSVCASAALGPGEPQEVLLVGGQSRSSAVRGAVEAAFGGRVGTDLAAEDAVAMGTAIAGWAMHQQAQRSGPNAAAALSKGLHLELEGGRFHALLARGAPLPCEAACEVMVGGKGMVRLAAWQFDAAGAFDAQYLGALFVRAPVGETVEVVFSVSRTGVLTVAARTGKGGPMLQAATSDLTEEGRAELEAGAALPEPRGREKADARRLLAR